jgi:hypothetical protein
MARGAQNVALLEVAVCVAAVVSVRGGRFTEGLRSTHLDIILGLLGLGA